MPGATKLCCPHCGRSVTPNSLREADGDQEAFWVRVDQGDPDECWPWTGTTLPKGYGTLYWDDRTRYAHRVAYEIANGSVEDVEVVMHTCDNPPCCNPNHLKAGTQSENITEALERGRLIPVGADVTPQDVRDIRDRYDEEDTTYAEIAEDYPINAHSVGRIVRGDRWGWVE